MVGEYGLQNLSVAVLIFDLGAYRRQKEEERVNEERERNQFAQLLPLVQGDITLARRVDAFVQQAFTKDSPREVTKSLRNLADQNFGRERRVDELYRLFGGMRMLDNLDWAAGRDILAVAAWAEICLNGQMKQWAVVKNGTFTFQTDRHFKCPSCGQVVNMPRGEWNALKNGQTVSLTCQSCKTQGWVSQDTVQSRSTPAPQRGPAQSGPRAEISEDMLAKLREKFGQR